MAKKFTDYLTWDLQLLKLIGNRMSDAVEDFLRVLGNVSAIEKPKRLLKTEKCHTKLHTF